MKVYQKKLQIETKKQFEMLDITTHVRTAVVESGIKEGMLTVFSPHTTASVKINHNEPLLMQDFMKTLYRLIPLDTSYSHDLFEVRQSVAPNERSNGHAHVKAFFLGASENLLVQRSELLLGVKQSVFFVEMDGGRSREVWVKIIGE